MKRVIIIVLVVFLQLESSSAQISNHKLSFAYDNLFFTKGDNVASFFNLGYSYRINGTITINGNLGYGMTNNLFANHGSLLNSTILINYEGRLRSELYMVNLGSDLNLLTIYKNNLCLSIGCSAMHYQGVSITSATVISDKDGTQYYSKVNLANIDELLLGQYLGLRYEQYLTKLLAGEIKVIRSFYNKGFGNWHFGIGLALKM